MNKSRKYKRLEILVLATLAVMFAVIVTVSEIHLKKKDYTELREHSLVIEQGIWNFDAESPLHYLELAAKLNNYERLTVYAVEDEVFAEVEGPADGPLDQFLSQIGLIPKIKLKADVLHDDKVIGKIEVINRNDHIYLYLYLLLVMTLVLLASRFFIRNLQAMDTLESRVKERTKELQIVNEQLQAGEKRYREIYNAPSDAIFMHDVDTGEILDINQGMLEMYGYSYEEALQLNMGVLSSGEHPYTIEEARRKIHKTLTEGPQTFEWLARKKNSTLFWVEVAAKYTEFSGKRYVIAVVRDVNDRKQAEADLAEEKERLAVTLRSIGDGVITTDVDGNVVMINKVAEELTGWSQAEALGMPFSEIFHLINDQTQEECENPVTKVLSTGGIAGLSKYAALISKDGVKRSIDDSGAPISDHNSQVIGVVVVFRDVTDKNRMEFEIIKGRKLESVGILAGGIAHDFNNILAAILGNINLVLTNTDKKDENYKLLMEAEKATMRARDLTQQLLTFSKGGDPVKKLADISEIIKDSASFILRGSNVRCNYQFEKDLWPVEIDSSQISEVIQNIVLNASQAMPNGGMIEISAGNIRNENQHIPIIGPNNYIELVIRDYGIGIPPDMLDKIFDPYFSTKQEGSGLGLAITHSIITKHGGHISAVSTPGKMTSFTIYLLAGAEKILPSIHEEEKKVFVGEGKIMIMDDEEMIRTFAGKMLSLLGFDVVFAKNGEEAIELFRSAHGTNDPVDLIIMDLTIPGGMGGKEAVKEIHKLDPDAKVIVASGYSTDPIMGNCQEFGFCAALPKPFRLKDLEKTISQILT